MFFHHWNLLWTHQTYRYPIYLRKKAGNRPNVLENSAYSFSTFLFFDKDILGNEAATELRIKAKLSNLRKGKSPSPSME